MKLSDFLKAVRFQLNDDGSEFVTSELIEYLNISLLYLSQTLANLRFRGSLKAVELQLTNGKATLPEDFVFEQVVVSPDGTKLKPAPVGETLQKGYYSILGNEIYAPYDSISVYYYSRINPVYDLQSDIPVRDDFLSLLKEMVVYLALNRTNVNVSFETQLSSLFEQRIRKIVSNYGYSDIPLVMPFKV